MPSSTSDTAAASSPPPALVELIEVSRAVGSDPDLVQGGGGNTSVKSRDGERMYVKASGTPLAGMDVDRGWAELELRAASSLLDRDDLGGMETSRREAEVLRRLASAVVGPPGARPSVEASLHALLDRVVIHTHPVGLGALLCARESSERVVRVVRGLSKTPPLYVPYTDPGYTLAARLRGEIDAYRARHGRGPSIVLLENHGLFVATGSVRSCLRLHREVTDAGMRWVRRERVNPVDFPWVVAPPSSGAQATDAVELAVRGALLAGGSAAGCVRRDADADSRRLAADPASVRLARQGGTLTPDQIVYCRTYPLVLPRSRRGWAGAVASYRERRGVDPRVVIVEGDSVYHAAPDLAQLRVVSEVYRGAVVGMLRSGRAGGPRFLPSARARFIEQWEVENYRASVLAGEHSQLSGRIAVVTGAGSGLGRGIARAVLEAGATVVGLDVDEQALEDVRSEEPAGRFLPHRCDVTDESSVREVFSTIVSSLGGIDHLVNAAGIAPPHPLVDFPLAAWRKTLEINLTGYFLCAREAARVLLAQGAGGGIVNLTSKSGLEASKANSAYNATKAGEIHLARGWALELGSAGIRVNCVAPGNVFKGSKIWNDEYIRVCARKRGIRPEEVIPYYNSLTSLGEEIEPQDVADAVIYLLSDRSRRMTGQVLVVDGGQVMVR